MLPILMRRAGAAAASGASDVLELVPTAPTAAAPVAATVPASTAASTAEPGAGAGGAGEGAATPRLRLGDLLVAQDLITAAQLAAALDEQRKTGKMLGRVLLDSGLVSDVQVARAIARQLRIEYVDVASLALGPTVAALLPESVARRLRALALGHAPGGGVRVVMADPSRVGDVDEIARHTRCRVVPCAGADAAIADALERVYAADGAKLDELVEELGVEVTDHAAQLAGVLGQAGSDSGNDDDAPVAKFVQQLLEQAVRLNASDLHIEPEDGRLVVRYRVDGVLCQQREYPGHISAAVASRLKVLAKLDIAEKRLPQDGRFAARTPRGGLDLRMSTMPCTAGESVVLRLLRQDLSLLELGHLGMAEDTLAAVKAALERPAGMILVTGPTGSGKTTTLYAMLASKRDGENKLITLEDPVEYRLAGITQVQAWKGLDFARMLRSALRQDPDVVMVGEIRDRETAEIATSAAMTGHLVLSTLHTNSAAGTPMRLLDMGTASYLVGASMELVIAQRLVRRICHHCAVPVEPTMREQAWLTARSPELLEPDRRGVLRRGRGCPACTNTGYRGRHAVYEHLSATPDLLRALTRNSPDDIAAVCAAQMAGNDLAADALRLVRGGLTTVSEAMRIDGSLIAAIAT